VEDLVTFTSRVFVEEAPKNVQDLNPQLWNGEGVFTGGDELESQ
jgi:hypothetical protein